jgi:drug/metabolite transporter (DMT)-like permease
MRKEYLMLIVTTFIWGSGHPIIKLILADLTPIQISMLSSALGALAVAIGLIVTKQIRNLAQLRGRGLSLALLSGIIMFFLYPMLSFTALQRIPASANSILVATSTIFVAVLSPMFLKERLDSKGIAAVLLSFVGVSLVVLSTTGEAMDLSALNLLGCSFSLLGAIASASYAIIGRRIMSALDALSVTLVGSLLGAVLLAVAVAMTSGFDQIAHASPMNYALMGYWGIFSGLAYVMFYYSLKRLEATKASSFIYLSPLFAVGLSILILGEKMTALFVAGMVLVLLGIWGTQRSQSAASGQSQSGT